MLLELKDFSLTVDFERGVIDSMRISERERLAEPSLLFRARLRDKSGATVLLTSADAASCEITSDGAIYDRFPVDLRVRVVLEAVQGEASWGIEVTPKTDGLCVEWVEFPTVTFPRLEKNNPEGTGGKILFPYNEGALVSDMENREDGTFRYEEPEYPSKGLFAVFPNMVCSQMLSYIWQDVGFYMGAHDARRGVKEINFLQAEKGVTLRFRLFCGVDFGETFRTDYPIVFSVTEGKWEAAAERYRQWFAENPPAGLARVSESDCLPEWYGDSPLVVTYPVRGVHDTDEMKPNRLYPYTNSLPILERIKRETDSRLLVLLMHWEGTAPWAPPYVWPPYGDVNNFEAFKDTLHQQGDLLGVYCSGFGYTARSNLIESYDKTKEYGERDLSRGMCADVDGTVGISRICRAQRSGYDICPASAVGRSILNEAYGELFAKGLDYAQILDQNHGGGQYFCYSRAHGHPPMPGTWMTERMQELLSDWNRQAGEMLLGCESAAAEPFVGNLRYSDNRYELNYYIGVPVPLYSYIYHEYLRNFMGNQVSCPLVEEDDRNLLYRLAYSFAAGDSMTFVLDQDGQIRTRWGKLKTDHVPDQEKLLRLVRNLTAFYREKAKPYLYAGRMIAPEEVDCPMLEFARRDRERTVCLPAILTTAWEAEDGQRVQLLVNPLDEETVCTVKDKEYTVPPLSAMLIER